MKPVGPVHPLVFCAEVCLQSLVLLLGNWIWQVMAPPLSLHPGADVSRSWILIEQPGCPSLDRHSSAQSCRHQATTLLSWSTSWTLETMEVAHPAIVAQRRSTFFLLTTVGENMVKAPIPPSWKWVASPSPFSWGVARFFLNQAGTAGLHFQGCGRT